MTQFIAILAKAGNGVIGKEGKLPWHLPKDLAFFKATTQGYPIIMGRKTFDSLGCKPLPKRRNIVFSRQAQYDNAEVVKDVSDLLERLKDEPKAYVIGGAELYNMLLPLCNECFVTEVRGDYQGDAFFNHDLDDLYANQETLMEEEAFVIKRYYGLQP